MGRLLDLANRLAGTVVPSVPSLQNQREPLQPAQLLAVPPVPSIPLEKHKYEDAEQLAAGCPEQAPSKFEADRWLTCVARLLECSPAYLLEHDFIDRHDLAEQYRTHPGFAAHLIRSHPDWSPPAPTDHGTNEQHDGEPQHLIHTAATASPEWIAARDQYHCHLFACPTCYAPTDRYCETGAELRGQYNATPWGAP